MTHTTQPGKHDLTLDGLRGIAALFVALGHCNTHLTEKSIWPKTVFDFSAMDWSAILARLWDVLFNADAAVVVFFVLSGYVLGEALRNRSEKPLDAAIPFTIRRIFRLYPVAILSAVPLIFLRDLSWRQTLETMLLSDITANGVIWSLQVELAGSLLVFILWALRRPVFALACIPAILLFGKLWPNLVLPNYILLFLPAFALGVLIRYLPQTIRQSRLLFWAALIILVTTDLVLGRNLATRGVQMAAAFLVVACLAARPFAFLTNRVPQFLGHVSYPFYLLHIGGMLLGTMLLHTFWPGSGFWFSLLVLIAISIPCGLLAAWLAHHGVEQRGIDWGNRVVTRYRKLIGEAK